jgi:sugar phosphate isomerase/epimerase
MKCSVTISLVPEARGGPFVFWDDLAAGIRQAAPIGFDGVEIFPPGPEAIQAEVVRGLLKENNLSLAAMGTGAGWVRQKLTLTSGDRAVRERAEAFIRSIIETAASLGAPAIIGSMQGRWGDGISKETAIGFLRDALNRLGEFAAKFNVPLLYEPLNRYETNLLTTVGDAAEFLRTLTTTNVKILADLFHMNIEEANLPAAIRAGKGSIGHVHFVDSNRRPAGLGHIGYGPIADALREIGYGGYLSAEALAYPDSRGAAEQTMVAFRKFFS